MRDLICGAKTGAKSVIIEAQIESERCSSVEDACHLWSISCEFLERLWHASIPQFTSDSSFSLHEGYPHGVWNTFVLLLGHFV